MIIIGMIIIGTRLQVYPAASLFAYASAEAFESRSLQHFETIAQKATVGVPELANRLVAQFRP